MEPVDADSCDVQSYVVFADVVVPTLVPKPGSPTVTQGNLRRSESAAKRYVELPWVVKPAD